MPSITIKEQEYAPIITFNATETIAYVPGMKNGGTAIVGKPVLVRNVNDFEKLFGASPRVIAEETSEQLAEYDRSYIFAKQLISVGMPIIYEVVPKHVAKGLSNEEATTREEVEETLADEAFWDKLNDRALYNIRFITSGGYNAIKTTGAGAEAIATNMTKLAAKRGDSLALLDIPKSVTTIEQINTIFNSPSSFTVGLDGEYAQAIVPWGRFTITVNVGVAKDEDSTDSTWAMPGSFAYLLAYARMIENYSTWFATAGITRGIVPLLVEPLAEYGELAINNIQSRDDGKFAINPICFVNPYGYRIYGNRTLKQNDGDLKAQSFVNVRNLCSDIKKTLYQLCKKLTFEQNSSILWANFRAGIMPLLDRMKSGQGIRAYKIEKVETGQKGVLAAKITISCIEAVEDFTIDLVLQDFEETEITEA